MYTETKADYTVDNRTFQQADTIVVGAGPVGVRFVSELLNRDPNADILLIGNERRQPYNRVLLSALLAGEIGYDEIELDLPRNDHFRNFRFASANIYRLDSASKMLVDEQNVRYAYKKLVLAMGARQHIPQIPGLNQSGVFSFRSLRDTETLYARTSKARDVVVMGGGLLGLEAAKAMQKSNTQVTVIQQGNRLMNRQLDTLAARRLQEKVEALGINVITESGVRKIHGEGRVTGVSTRDKQFIACDTVVLCTGIQPNIEIARNDRIKIRTGILVDSQLRTSAEDVYAIGECCEHEGVTYGLVSPGYEQAAILADVLVGGQSGYHGSAEVSRLKVVGESVVSMGEVAELGYAPYQKELRYRSNGCYRKLVVRRGVIVGAIAIGPWEELQRIQEAFQQQRKLHWWQLLLFRVTGRLWPGQGANDIKQWPDAAIVCQCNAVNKGALVNAFGQGCQNVAALGKSTGAGTVCGSCKPLLQQLMQQLGGEELPSKPEPGWSVVSVSSVLTVLAALLVILLPGIAVSTSVQSPAFLQDLWNDKFWKQVSGFTLVGLSVVGLLMSLRKRLKWIKLGEFAHWRLLHIALGLVCAFILILHTGLHMGHNLNRLLMLDFLAVLLMGSAAGMAVSASHKLSATQALKVRKWLSRLHLWITWPLPALLGIHILTVYYY